MADARPATVRALDVEARTSTIYPREFANAVAGREKRALGDQFGLSQFGVNLTTLAPGSSSALRHWHAIEDEFIYVIEGEITLVDEAGEHRLGPGMCAGFKAGSGNGHKLVNKTAGTAAYLEVGTRSPVEQVTYPDVDLKAEKTAGQWTLTRKNGVPF